LSFRTRILRCAREAGVITGTTREPREMSMVAWFGSGMGEGLWTVVGLLAMALLAGFIWFMVRQPSLRARTTAPPAERESPVEFLDRRFAEGEIPLAAYAAQRTATVRLTAAFRERERVVERQGYLG
jgi:uncharacterized membrane protein